MATTRISDFFNGKFFEIPKYQRGYTWDFQNIGDLFDDISESIDSNSNHYIGAIVLSKDEHDPDKFYIVDGQQRITTITMIMQSLVNNLDEKNKLFYERFYIKEDDKYRLKPLNRDGKYFTNILSGNILDPENKSQRYLKDAMERINFKVQNIDNKLSFLKSIEKLQIMEFIENTKGDAIRIFQTVNDRGKLLSNMEKAKSLLIYFSNRYINGTLDETISEYFSELFEVYDDLKQLGEQLNITIIKNKVFSEDTIMSYHFISFSSENYAPTPEYVLQHLKNNLQEKRSNPNELKDFITRYVLSLKDFFNATKSLLLKANADAKYYKVFSILQVSATLYPLIIKLEVMDKLNRVVQITDKKNVSFFDLIELIDVRVYKTRGTDPRAQIARFTCNLVKMNDGDIAKWLIGFNNTWMSKEQFQVSLNSNIFGNRALNYIFLTYCEHILNVQYSTDELKKINSLNPNIEHILSQMPNFDPIALGFNDEEDYINYKHRLGNLTLLEKSLNSSVQNKVALDKVVTYDKSILAITKQVSAKITDIKGFLKKDLNERTKNIAEYVSKRWWCETGSLDDTLQYIGEDDGVDVV
jgi:uncharacterized protein with ParB-like and HNH nuclease domain